MKNRTKWKIDNRIKSGDDGAVLFSKPLTITDNTTMWSGAKYDIESMDITPYDGKVTVNHSMKIQDIVGEAIGLEKKKNKVTIDGIKFAVNKSSLAQFTHDMMLEGLVTDVSVETTGPWPDEDGVYKDSSLVGLSIVVTGNNKSARINDYKQVFYNSLEKAKHNGLDVTDIEPFEPISNNTTEDDMKFVTIKNSRTFSLSVTYKNAAGEEVTAELAPGQTIDVSEDQKDLVQNQINDAKEAEKENDGVDKILSKLGEMETKYNELEQKLFDSKVEEPKFKKNNMPELKDQNYKVRAADQINYAWEWLKGGSQEAQRKLNDINKLHLEMLQEKGIVPNLNPVTKNQITLADFGNFVNSPELLKDIEGFRSNYTPLINALDWRETLSLQMAWLVRSGDISMSEVEMCDDGEDGNRKPISEYGAEIETANMHELAAVTPVCNAATRFLAVDLLADVAAGYRTDYDRKRAQLAIARLQQAISSTGNSALFDQSTDLDAVKSFIQTLRPVAERVMNGTFIFNHSTYWQLIENLVGVGVAGPLSALFTTGDQQSIVGRPYIVVPDDLMPTLGTSETKSFTVEGSAVTIDQAVIYADLSTFTGRTSGGLQYDLSTEAAYEVVSGQTVTVRSAYQRNELVLRGSFFRNGAVKDVEKVAGLSDFSIS